MQTEAANLTLYRGAAFRLPALQRDRNEDPGDSQPPSKVAHICPRELRAMQASESTLVAKQRRLLLQKSKALLKRKRNAEIVERCSPLLPSINHSRQQADEKSDLQDSVDVMSFLTRELTVSGMLPILKASFNTYPFYLHPIDLRLFYYDVVLPCDLFCGLVCLTAQTEEFSHW